MGHYQLQFAVLPPLIADAIVRLWLGPLRPVRSGAWLGLLMAAQLFIGEEMLFESVLAAAILLLVLAVSRASRRVAAARSSAAARGLVTAAVVAAALSSWGLWTQFAGPLTQHGSPFAADTSHSGRRCARRPGWLNSKSRAVDWGLSMSQFR